jgi:AcrR family transcriptional regulator
MRKPLSRRQPPAVPGSAAASPSGKPLPALRGRKLGAPERREAVLAAALPLFARRGWLGTGTRELAAAAGVTEPILYRHFADKQALFLAVLARSTVSVEQVLARHVAAARGAAARLEALATGLGEVLDHRLDDLRVLETAASALDQPALADAARAHLTHLSGVLAEALRGSGLGRGVDPLVAGGLLLEVGLGASLLWPLGVPVMLRPDFRARAVALLLRAFTSSSP